MSRPTVQTTIHRLKVRATDDPLFDTVARLVNPPAGEPTQTTFLPAYAGFNIGTGADVDISYFGAPPSDRPWDSPRGRFDRHLRTEELWVVAEGDFYVPMAVCRRPDDPQDSPRHEDMLCFFVKEGDLFTVRPN